ncbi:glutathione S-transferase [Lichenibacterium minor]|uniref:Glutathione S-transferase n=1 Tax=Lichenibacterium minor TaxID=2316528 RepID=A0A4Q2U143_9HYPH|nr:MAPEG family protein [Lichenibacterium minor]RYC29982.1 glutathione S-transferase [Lichenibacterium minor]
MLFPATTAAFAAVLALVYAGLTVWVMLSRTSKGTLQGDGGDAGLEKRVRAHGNFGEYVPLALVVIALLEGGGGSHGLVLTLLWLLLIGRLLHPAGLFARPNTAQMFACRGGGMLATLAAIVVGAVALLLGHV